MAENTQNNTANASGTPQTPAPVTPSGDILSREAELLGETPGAQGTSQSGAGQTTGQKPVNFNLNQAIAKYNIPALVTENYPKIIPLIIQTESMDDEEREYWFQMIPIMNLDQIKKLEGILNNEREQLAKLDSEYEAELKKIDEKHMLEWKEFEMKQKKEEIAQKENITEEEEQATEEELLKKLQNL
jgi:hypothetical protein